MLFQQISYQSTNYDRTRGKTITNTVKYYNFDKLLERTDRTIGNSTTTELVYGQQDGTITVYNIANKTSCSCYSTYGPFDMVCYDIDEATDGSFLGLEGKKVEILDSQGGVDSQWFIKKESWDKETCVPLSAYYSDSQEVFSFSITISRKVLILKFSHFHKFVRVLRIVSGNKEL